MQQLLAEYRKKDQAGFISEANIYEQKYYVAKSYTMDVNSIKPGDTYRVIGESEPFTVRYLNGVFAWGEMPSSEELKAFPIGRLEES